MTCLEQLAAHLIAQDAAAGGEPGFTPEVCRRVMQALVQQAMEKIDRTRAPAGTT